MYKRIAEEKVIRMSKSFKVLLVTGPRQVGKTTLLESLKSENMNYVTLDDKNKREKAKNDPKLFLEENPWPLFIDEAQKAPELFSYIKINVDKYKQKSMYWLTGSQRFSLMKNVKESLAGRVGIVEMNSFNYNEIKQNNKTLIFDPTDLRKAPRISVNKLYEMIFKGGMPELYDNSEIDINDFFESYITTYIEKDVKDIIEISNEVQFRNFIADVACRNCEQLNYQSLADDIGISQPTAKAWMSVLVKTGLVYLLQPYSNNSLKRVVRTPKIIFMDSGLCAFLEKIESPEELQNGERAGHYLESYIISDIIKNYNSISTRTAIYYYRDAHGKEIDLIIKKNNILYPYEIKKTASPNLSMIKNFQILEEGVKKVGTGGLICLHDSLEYLNRKHYIIPISSVINASIDGEKPYKTEEGDLD